MAPPSGHDVRAFIELYTTHEVRLRALSLSLVPNWDGANEVLQETSLVLWAKFAEFDPDTSFFAWAAAIMQFKAKEYRRKLAISQRAVFDDDVLKALAAEVVTVSDLLADRERVLHDCIAKLAGEHMKMLRLRYGEGNSIKRVAEVMNRTEVAVRKALSRVRKLLADCIAKRLKAEGSH